MKIVRWALASVAGLFLILQFIRPDRSAGPVGSESSVVNLYPVPADVREIMGRACLDCHSNGTRYPWYSEIQPVGWWMQGHIDEARSNLNFDEFGGYPLFRQYIKFQEVESEVRDEFMPLESYLPMHPEARLTESERSALVAWSQAMRDSMSAWYPPDSLQRRRERPAPATE